MRVNFSGQLGLISQSLNTSIVTNISTPLILKSDPTVPLEAATKQYVDTKVSSLNASDIKSGTISIARFPAYTGDLTCATGSGTFNLSATGVSLNNYTKVTVNAKGRVTAAGSLSSNDIPVFNWNKIISGKPTTLAGYGITDGVSTSGGTLSGILSLNSDPTEALHAANKQYTDSMISTDNGIRVGFVITRNSNVTPEGFLKCNGGEVSKTTYSALYSVIGDTFSYTTMPGAGQPWRQQYDINLENNGDITDWTTGTSLPGALAYSQAIVTKNRVYLLGGFNGSAFVSTVYTAPINSDGTLGTWTTGTSLPGALGHSQAIVTKNRVYLLGGQNGSNSVSTVYTAPINGGLNDYSPYYDGTITPIEWPIMNKFFLPDLTNKEATGTYYYIKY